MRNITYVTGKLPALSGIAQVFLETTGLEYLAGHWDDPGFVAGLTWLQIGSIQRYSAQSTKYWALFWSWLSLDLCQRLAVI